MTRRLSHEEYLEQLNQLNATVEPIEKYIKSATEIPHKCKLCGAIIYRSPNRVISYLKKGLYICQQCSGKKLFIGKNDLWTTDPEIASMLKNPEDGYRTTRKSDKKFDWVCPNCGCVITQKSVNNTVVNGLVCHLCGHTRSLGHRLVNSVLEEIGINYINEKTFYWLHNRQYDIYIEDKNCIIEVHGIQHYEECGFTLLEYQIENDKLKKDTALMNGIENYIVIDARISDMDFIITSIKNNTDFNSLFDISEVSWKNVVSNISTPNTIRILNLYNNGKSVSQIAENVHLSDVVVSRKLNDLTKYGLCEYKGVGEKYKPVVCLNTGEEFENLQQAGQKYNIDPNGISFCCRGLRNRKTAGKLQDGTKLTWLFKEDYKKKTKEEIQAIIDLISKKPIGQKKVVCLNTGEIFNSIKQAMDTYPTAKSISDCCRHICISSGTHPETNDKLKWRYYDEYCEMSDSEIKEILSNIDYNDKRVICLNTLDVFDNAIFAGEWCGVKRSGVTACISGKHIVSGKHPETGELLRWMKYKDYIKENQINAHTNM